MSINNRLIQDTLYDWTQFVYPNVPVLWRNQEVPQARFPYANLWIRSLMPWGDRDEVLRDYDASRPLGQEIHHTARAPREMRVDLDVYSVSNDADTDALSLGTGLIDSLQNDDVRALLDQGGVSFLRVAFQRQMSQIENETHVNRFYAELLFCVVAATLVNRSGYIATAVVSSDPTNEPDFDQTQTVVLE